MAKSFLKESFIRLLTNCDDIEVHESYAGMGTAGAALAEQFSMMRSKVASELSAGHLNIHNSVISI